MRWCWAALSLALHAAVAVLLRVPTERPPERSQPDPIAVELHAPLAKPVMAAGALVPSAEPRPVRKIATNLIPRRAPTRPAPPPAVEDDPDPNTDSESSAVQPAPMSMRPLPSPYEVARHVVPLTLPPAPNPLIAPPEKEPPPGRRRPSDFFWRRPVDDRDARRLYEDYSPEDLNRSFFDSGWSSPRSPPRPGGGDDRASPLGRPQGGGRHHAKRPGFTADVEADGSVQFYEQPALQAKLLPCLRKRKTLRECAEERHFPIVRVHFDLNDWLERLAGNDPYQYGKYEFLEATRPERERMARSFRRELLQEAVLAAPDLLRGLWADESLTPEERRRLLFELWDDCAEEGDEELLTAARAFRATVISFIRRTLPPPSPHGYAPAELEALNRRRRSKEAFDPHGGPAGD